MSKELEALKELREVRGWNDKEFNERLDIIETTLKDYERVMVEKNDLFKRWSKEHQVLEIIKNKKVNIAALLELDSLQQYNDYCDMVGGCKKLTPEEYSLLKEVLL